MMKIRVTCVKSNTSDRGKVMELQNHRMTVHFDYCQKQGLQLSDRLLSRLYAPPIR